MQRNSSPAEITIGLVQMACCDDPMANIDRALELARDAARAGARIICLQELFRTTYFCRTQDEACFQLAETIPGPTTEEIARFARRHRVAMIAPVFEKRAPGIFHNSAAVIGPHGDLAGLYRKMHIPHDPGFEEKYYFSPGDLGFPAISLLGTRIAVLICWDQWFPEAARLAALAGAQIIFYPTAIGWLPSDSRDEQEAQASAWETVQRSHAITNNVFVASVNRVGREDSIYFWGASFVADPFGRIIARAGNHSDATVVARCDLRAIDMARQAWPFMRDRRTDAYTGISSRFIDTPLASQSHDIETIGEELSKREQFQSRQKQEHEQP